MKLLFNWLIYTLAVSITSYLLSGVRVGGLAVALLAALVLGLINAILRPILIFFTLPITFFTMGLFVLIINAGLVLLASKLVNGFYVAGFWWALSFSIIIVLINWLLRYLVKK